MVFHLGSLALLLLRAAGSTAVTAAHTDVTPGVDAMRFDGIGGLSGGGATSNFFGAYPEDAREEMLDWLFLPNYGASLEILKVEIGADDQTTDGTEAGHMRTPTEVDCHRGYEWPLMKAAVARNPSITLYGLPWGFAGWLGFGTTNPYHNVSATADYIVRWVECGRDAHGLNISVVGLWNEAWEAAERPTSDPWEYLLALRARLDAGGLAHVRIQLGDLNAGGESETVVPILHENATLRASAWGIGAHYPNGQGGTASWEDLGLPMWATEDYSTHSDATGAACWARLLVTNTNWGYGATITWYLLSSYARGMSYIGDGLLRAEWPASGHWEVTPMAWTTMHWTLFTKPGWAIASCTDGIGGCKLSGGGHYAIAYSGADVTIVVEAFTPNASRCIRHDPPDWDVKPQQTATFTLPLSSDAAAHLEVWRSCSSWRYPADSDSYMQRQKDLPVVVGAGGERAVTLTVDRNCYYTLTTLRGREKPKVPAKIAPSKAFPLPFKETFEGPTSGGEAPFFGDQQGKWETVPAGGGRGGHASEQVLRDRAPWPIIEPQCNTHSAPLSIVGDFYFKDVRVAADVLLVERGVGAGLGLRVRDVNPLHWRNSSAGLYVYLGATPGYDKPNAGGLAPPANADAGWALCADSMCFSVVARGPLAAGAGVWRRLSFEITRGYATATVDNKTIFADVTVGASVPASGWAAVVATLGQTQIDNFALEGTAAGGAAAPPCSSAAPSAGAPVVTTPCDYPAAQTQWNVDAESGVLRLRGTELCLGSADGVVELVACGGTVLRHDAATGRVVAPDGRCLNAVQRAATDAAHTQFTLASCNALPDDAQQFQANPATGALRQKGSQCVHDFPGSVPGYRDCCAALCY